MSEIVFRLVRQNALGNSAVHLRMEEAALVVVDHKQPMRLASRRFEPYGLGAFEKVTQGHKLGRFGNILRAAWVQDQDLPVARDLQVAVGLFLNLSYVSKQSVYFAPSQIVRERMLEDCLVGAQVRTGQLGRWRHLFHD